MRVISVLSVLLLVGCDGQGPPGPIPTEVWNLFPFDGDRTWRYANDDAPYNIGGEIIDAEVLPNVNLYAVSYTKLCRVENKQCVTGDELLNLRWSSDATLGVRIHSYTFNDIAVNLTPPLLVSEDTAVVDVTQVTTIDGTDWTTSFSGVFTCPSTQTNDWNCGLFEITADSKDGGVPLSGQIYAARGQGMVAFDLSMDDYGLWEDAGTTCSGDCNGSW